MHRCICRKSFLLRRREKRGRQDARGEPRPCRRLALRCGSRSESAPRWRAAPPARAGSMRRPLHRQGYRARQVLCSPRGYRILRRFRLGADERAAHYLDPFERRRALRDSLRLRDGKEDRLTVTGHGNRVDRLGQSFRAGHADGENRVDLLVFDRARKLRESEGYRPTEADGTSYWASAVSRRS